MLTALISWVAIAADEHVVEEAFDIAPKPPWAWLRESPQDWRIRSSALEISVRPGDAQSVRNALLRPAPDRDQGRFAIELTVTSLSTPTEQFEQAGITWYSGGEPVLKLVKERVDGQLMIIPGRKPMTNETVQLRLEVDAKTWKALFRPEAKGDYVLAGTGELPLANQDQVSIQCYHGPADRPHWIRFDDFRILKLKN